MFVESTSRHLLTPRELAFRLSMSLKWVEKQTQARRIPGQTKIGRVWRYDWIAIEKRLVSGTLLLDRISMKRP
jgi:hypothetical protein